MLYRLVLLLWLYLVLGTTCVTMCTGTTTNSVVVVLHRGLLDRLSARRRLPLTSITVTPVCSSIQHQTSASTLYQSQYFACQYFILFKEQDTRTYQTKREKHCRLDCRTAPNLEPQTASFSFFNARCRLVYILCSPTEQATRDSGSTPSTDHIPDNPQRSVLPHVQSEGVELETYRGSAAVGTNSKLRNRK